MPPKEAQKKADERSLVVQAFKNLILYRLQLGSGEEEGCKDIIEREQKQTRELGGIEDTYGVVFPAFWLKLFTKLLSHFSRDVSVGLALSRRFLLKFITSANVDREKLNTNKFRWDPVIQGALGNIRQGPGMVNHSFDQMSSSSSLEEDGDDDEDSCDDGKESWDTLQCEGEPIEKFVEVMIYSEWVDSIYFWSKVKEFPTDYDDQMPLSYCASHCKNPEILKIALEKDKMEVTDYGRRLVRATRENLPANVRLLIEVGGDNPCEFDDTNWYPFAHWSPIHIASFLGRSDVLRTLLEGVANREHFQGISGGPLLDGYQNITSSYFLKDLSPIFMALVGGHPNCLRQLLAVPELREPALKVLNSADGAPILSMLVVKRKVTDEEDGDGSADLDSCLKVLSDAGISVEAHLNATSAQKRSKRGRSDSPSKKRGTARRASASSTGESSQKRKRSSTKQEKPASTQKAAPSKAKPTAKKAATSSAKKRGQLTSSKKPPKSQAAKRGRTTAPAKAKAVKKPPAKQQKKKGKR